MAYGENRYMSTWQAFKESINQGFRDRYRPGKLKGCEGSADEARRPDEEDG